MSDQGLYKRFLAVVGPSGSGKSSVVKAGLIPAFRAGAVARSDAWFVVEMIPGTRPLDELEVGLLGIDTKQLPDLMTQLRRDSWGLTRVSQLVLPKGDSELLLIVDQFEELFTRAVDTGDQEQFLKLIYQAITEPGSRVRVIITLRADFYDRPLLDPDFSQLMKARTEVVVPMTAEELGQAVAEPAGAAGAQVEPELLAQIVADVSEQPGALPLLQYALTELFERRSGNVLTLDSYRAIGGVSGAIARRAEETYAGLDNISQEATRQLFLRLVTLGEGTEDTRRRVLRSELTSIETFEVSETSKVLALFGSSRLLTFDRDPGTREPTVEVAHEALLREWERLRAWLDDNRADVRLQRLLANSVSEWLESGRDPGFLLRGSRLTQFEEWSAQTALALTGDERTYLDASLADRRKREAAEAERQAHEADLERRSRNRLRALIGVFALAAVIAVGLSIFAFDRQDAARKSESLALEGQATATVAQGEALFQAGTAEAERVRAEEERSRAESETEARATQESIAIVAAEDADQQRIIAETNEREALEAYSLSLARNVQQALSHGDSDLGLLLALAANGIPDAPLDAKRALMDAAYAPGTRRLFETGSVNWTVASSPANDQILSGSNDGAVRLWAIESGELLHQFEGHEDAVLDVAFSPDGNDALSASADGSLIHWDLEAGEELQRLTGHSLPVQTVAYSPDGRTALSGSSADGPPGELILWDLESGQVISYTSGLELPEGIPEGILSLAISSDGTTALVGQASLHGDNPWALTLWDLESGELLRTFAGIERSVNGVDIDLKGATGLSASDDGLVRLWDLETGELLLTMEGHEGSVADVAYSANGKTALSASADQTVIWWDLKTGKAAQRYRGHSDQVRSVAYVGDAQMVTASSDGTLRYWDLESNWLIERWPAEQYHQSSITDVAMSPDGRYALSGAGWPEESDLEDHHYLILWDYDTGKPLRLFSNSATAVSGLAFAPNSNKALVAYEDGTVIMWAVDQGTADRGVIDWQTGPELGIGHTSRVPGAAISTDNEYVLTGDTDGLLILRYARTGVPLGGYGGHGQAIQDVAFTADNTHFISASEDGSFILWDAENGEQIRRLTGLDSLAGSHLNAIDPGIFSIDIDTGGRWGLTAARDNDLILWDLSDGQSVDRLMGHTTSVYDVASGPDGQTALSSGFDNTIILWDPRDRNSVRSFFHSIVLEEERGPVIAIAPDGQTALSAGPDNQILKWRLSQPELSEPLEWIPINPFIGELSCEQRQTYKIEPLFGEGEEQIGSSIDLLTSARKYALEDDTEPKPPLSESEAKMSLVGPVVELPRPILKVEIGENKGQLQQQDFDVWMYSSPGGEIMNIHLLADQPNNSKAALIDGRIVPGQLDTFLLVKDPEGIPIAANDDWISSQGEWSSNTTIENLPFSFPGEYRIEARSYMDEGDGRYTLKVQANTYVVDMARMKEYVGNYEVSVGDVSITLENGNLYIPIYRPRYAAEGLDMDNSLMIPVSDDVFITNTGFLSVPLTVYFERDEAGQ